MFLRAATLGLAGLASLASGAETNLVSVACGEEIVLRVSNALPPQGTVLIVEIRSEEPIDSVESSWNGKPLRFWHDAGARVFQALLGVDFREPPGVRSVRARVFPARKTPLDCEVEIRVEDGEFAVQRITVAPKFVELNPKDFARSRRESAELNVIFLSSTPERIWRNSFGSPVPGYEPSGSFGKRRVFNGQPRNPHSGEDYSAPAGEPVLAPSRGRVALAKDLFFLGNAVVLDHGFGLISFYGHLSSVSVEPGTVVDAGTELGKVGATGRVTGAHLHWGVRLNDARVDPKALVSLTR